MTVNATTFYQKWSGKSHWGNVKQPGPGPTFLGVAQYWRFPSVASHP